MTVYAITDTKKGEQGLRLLIFKLPQSYKHSRPKTIRRHGNQVMNVPQLSRRGSRCYIIITMSMTIISQ